MAQVCEQIYNPDTDQNEEFCWDDGSNEVGESVSGDATGESVSGSFTWGDAPGAAGSKSTVDAKTGNITYQYDDGSTLTVDSTGAPVGNTESADAKGNSAAYNRSLTWATKTFGPTAGKVFANMMANPGASLLTALAAAKAFAGSDKEGGYNVPIPKLDMVQQQVQYNDPNRRPGAAGRQYFTDPRYVKEGDAASIEGAQNAAATQAAGILAAYKPTAAPAVNPYIGKMKRDYNPAPVTAKPGATTTEPVTPVTPPATNAGIASLPAMPTKEQLMDPNFKIGMASGGIASATGRYLRGGTDGMADRIPAAIDEDQPAALSHGEFVIPADVVSHLGNGNSDAGADKLYQMMARIRKARTGNEKQGKRINPDKFMPGGSVQGMAGGGKTSSESEAEWAARQPDTSKIVDSMERKNALESWQKSRPGYVDPMDYKTYEDYAGAADISLGRDEGNDLTNRANFYGMSIENYQNALSGDQTRPMGGNQAVYGSQLLSPLERIAAETARAQGLGTMSPEVAALAKANPEVFNAAAQKWQQHMSNTYPGTLEYQSVLSGPARYSSEGVKNPELLDTVNMYILDPRTGQIIKNPNYKKKTSGGLAAAYAAGGNVKGFDGTTGSAVTTGTGVPLDTSKTSTLSPWAGDYVTNMLGKTQALVNSPMQTYGGPLTAGASDLQNQGFAGISETAAAGYQPGTFTNQFTAPGAYKPTTSSFDTAAATQYMNP